MGGTTLRIGRRFCGPPLSGNGGYVAGLLARELGSTGCVVTLKSPPPLDEELRLEHQVAEVSLFAGERLIALAEPADLEVDVPAPPAFDQAAQAESRFTGWNGHVFPGCFVCGPERAAGDGLRIFPGRMEDRAGSQVAATWIPDPSLAGSNGLLKPEFIWSALDCPGYFAAEPNSGPAVLGRLGVAIHRCPSITDRLIVTGWPIESSGRKHLMGTALHDDAGMLVAAATATWIAIEAPG
jgi:acyl-coenzyme A thioesterase PaaI-like protein